jgi:hypothetical protein
MGMIWGTKMIKKIALAAALLAASTLTASAKDYSLNVTLDGFCNTFSLTTSGITVWGNRSGCGYTNLSGGTVGKAGGKYIIANDSTDLAEVFTWYFTPPNRHGKGSFTLYYSDGTSQTELNSGTYAPTPQGGAARNAPDVTKLKK